MTKKNPDRPDCPSYLTFLKITNYKFIEEGLFGIPLNLIPGREKYGEDAGYSRKLENA
jgi:hypothetical protein